MASGHFVCFVALHILERVGVEIVLVGVGPAIPTGTAGYTVAVGLAIECVEQMLAAVAAIEVVEYIAAVERAAGTVGYSVTAASATVAAGLPIEIVGAVASA